VFLVNNFLAEEGISMELVAGLVICLIGLEGELVRAGVGGKTGLEKRKFKKVKMLLSSYLKDLKIKNLKPNAERILALSVLDLFVLKIIFMKRSDLKILREKPRNLYQSIEKQVKKLLYFSLTHK